jgi:YVTN family beta-propeller protein
VGKSPYDLAITPNGKTVYAADYGSRSVTPINVATNTALSPIPLTNAPVAIAIAPKGRTVYVCTYTVGLTPINVAANKALTPIAVSDPVAIAITPNGKTAYVPQPLLDTVAPVNLATGAALPRINVGSTPVAVAITP